MQNEPQFVYIYAKQYWNSK